MCVWGGRIGSDSSDCSDIVGEVEGFLHTRVGRTLAVGVSPKCVSWNMCNVCLPSFLFAARISDLIEGTVWVCVYLYVCQWLMLVYLEFSYVLNIYLLKDDKHT